MIKVLFFIEKLSYNGFIGGAEKALITLVNHMDQSKFDITVQTVFPDPFYKLLHKNIHYRYCYRNKNAISTMVYRIEAETGLIYRCHFRDDSDIEIAFLEYDTTKVISKSTNKRAKKVAWVHCDFDVAVQNKKRFVRKTRRQYEKFDQIVCVSEQCRKSFKKLYSEQFDPIVLHNVIDDEEIIDKAEEPLPRWINKTKRILCNVGNFTPAKNHLRLLRACKKLRSEGWEFELWLVGDGGLREEIEDYIEENDLKKIVKLCGFQPNPYPYMQAADLLVCSSDYEGLSTFITEGVILHKRILTTDCSGMHEILDGYPAGMIVSVDDEEFYLGLVACFKHSEDFADWKCPGFSTKTLVKENEDFFMYCQNM